MRAGATFMLPTEDAIFVGEELKRRFGLPSWQMALTATDANRFAIRLARHVTGRPKILVYNGCYHGTVDETFIALEDGRARARSGNIGPPVDPTVTTKVIEFNDVAALEAALAPRDVACVLAEPAMTNIGIVLPDPGYHAALRDVTRRTGTLLIIDETHTICCGTGGYTRAHGLEPGAGAVGNFLYVDVGDDSRPLFEALLREGVIVRPLHGFGAPTAIRVTSGTVEETRFFADAFASARGSVSSR